MPVYLVAPLSTKTDALSAAVERAIPDPADRYLLPAERGWLIRYAGTSVELSNLIGITGQAPGDPPTLGPALVVPITAYYGRGPTDMWEWIKTRFDS
jgi:hypothetical protein